MSRIWYMEETTHKGKHEGTLNWKAVQVLVRKEKSKSN